MELLISLLAIVISSVSIIVVIWKMGLGLGLEFVEKQEVRGMKKNCEEILKNEWRSKLEKFIEGYTEMKKTKDEETITEEFSDLGEAARQTVIVSIMLKTMKRTVPMITKSVITSIGLMILLAGTIWASLTYPTFWRTTQDPEFFWPFLIFMQIIFLAIFLNAARRDWRNYSDIRSYFYEISDKPSLSKAKEISAELRRRNIDLP